VVKPGGRELAFGKRGVLMGLGGLKVRAVKIKSKYSGFIFSEIADHG